LPEGDDPDSFVNKSGLEGFLELLNKAMPMFEFYLDLKITRLNDGIDGQVILLKEMVPVLNELNNDSQRSLYIRRLSEKSGIAESIVLAELHNRQADQSGKEHEDNIRKRLSGLKAKRGDDLPLLNLLIHAPHTMNRLMNLDCKVLLSDPIIMEIFDFMYEIYTKEGKFTPTEMLEKLEGESTRERFREAMLSSPIYPDEVVEQAVREFEDRVYKIKLSESINKAREQGDIESLNQLLKQKSSGQY